MEPFPARPPARPRRSFWGIACVVLLPVAGGLLLLGGRPHTALRSPSAVGRGSLPAPAPQFPDGPTPPGDVSLKNLHFQPLEFPGSPAFFSSLRVSRQGDTVTITETGKERAGRERAGRERAGKEGARVWSGPATASFFLETVGGVHTLKDASGKVLWSNAARVAQADLLFEKTEDGQARLTGRGGVRLWAGQLPPSAQGGVDSHQGERTLLITPGVRVEGTGGIFRVSSGRLLWSGPLPHSPLLVVRDGHNFMVEGPSGSESGSDEASRVSMAAGAETVTVADAHGRTLGTRIVDALTIRRTTGLSPLPQGFNQPVLSQAQDGRLDAVGTLLLTYRDGAGRVVRRSRIYKDGRGGYGASG